MTDLTTTADRILREAYSRAPEASACRPGIGGLPSRLADSLMDLAEGSGGECEFRIGPAEFEELRRNSPTTLWHRAVFRLPDGSILAVHDSGADIAPSERFVIRHASGEFAGVWNGESNEELGRALGMALDRLGPVDEDLVDDVAQSFSFDQARRGELPLSELRGVPAVGEDGTAILATTKGVQMVPGDSAGIHEQLNHAYACMDRMTVTLGIPRAEMLSEISPQVKVYMQALEEYERNANISPEQSIREFEPRL